MSSRAPGDRSTLRYSPGSAPRPMPIPLRSSLPPAGRPISTASSPPIPTSTSAASISSLLRLPSPRGRAIYRRARSRRREPPSRWFPPPERHCPTSSFARGWGEAARPDGLTTRPPPPVLSLAVAQLDLAFGENFNLSGAGVGRSTGAAVILFIPRTFQYHWIIAISSTPRRCCLDYSRILIAVIGFVMTPCCVYSYPVPSSKCDMSTVPVDRSREVVEKEWCEVTEQAPKINSNGVFRDRSGSTDTCDGCAPNCGDPEAPQPVGKTCTTLLSVSFTDTKERTTKGIVGGGAGGIFAGLEASLEMKIGYKSEGGTKVERSVSVSIAPCTWQTEQIFMRVLNGKSMSVSASISACKQIRDTRLKLTYLHIGPAQTGTLTLTCNLGLNGDSTIRTVANGKCPRP